MCMCNRSRIFPNLYVMRFSTITSSWVLLWVFYDVLSFAFSLVSPVILPGTMHFVEPSSARKIDLCNLPDTICLLCEVSVRESI